MTLCWGVSCWLAAYILHYICMFTALCWPAEVHWLNAIISSYQQGHCWQNCFSPASQAASMLADTTESIQRRPVLTCWCRPLVHVVTKCLGQQLTALAWLAWLPLPVTSAVLHACKAS